MKTFKVNPKTFTDFDGFEHTITGIRGSVLLPLGLVSTGLEVQFYFEFIREDESVRGSKSATEKDIFAAFIKAIAADDENPTDEEKAQARTQADTIIKDLIAGTGPKRFAAASTLAASYGYTLLPLAEQ